MEESESSWKDDETRSEREVEGGWEREERAREVNLADAPALRYDSQSKQVPSSLPEGRHRTQRRVSRRKRGSIPTPSVFARLSARKNGFPGARPVFSEKAFSPTRRCCRRSLRSLQICRLCERNM